MLTIQKMEENDVLTRWTEYCAELCNHRARIDPEVLNVPPATNNDNHPILREEVEAAVRSFEKEEVRRSGQHPSRTGPSRGRSND